MIMFAAGVADAIALVLFSCLIGFLLGRHSATAGWLLVPQQQPKVLQQHRSGWEVTSDNPNTAAVQLLQYAALAWQQLRHVLLAIAAAGAKCAAALLGLLAAKASDAAVAASDAAATAASHVRRQCGAQYVDAPGYDVSEDNDVDDGLSSVQDQDSAAPSFIAFLANNKQQRLSLQMQDPHEQQEQQQQVAAWRGMHSQPPAPPAAAAGDSLTFATPCNSSWNNSDACRTAATSSASACRTNYPAGSMCNVSTSSSGSRRTPVSRLDSGPLPMSGAASLNASVTPLGCGWMCVMSRSSPAVEAAAVQQPGSAQEQRQQQRQQQELDGNIAQQLAGEDISLGEWMRPCFLVCMYSTSLFDEAVLQCSALDGYGLGSMHLYAGGFMRSSSCVACIRVLEQFTRPGVCRIYYARHCYTYLHVGHRAALVKVYVAHI
jgi:hypothetical protein